MPGLISHDLFIRVCSITVVFLSAVFHVSSGGHENLSIVLTVFVRSLLYVSVSLYTCAFINESVCSETSFPLVTWSSIALIISMRCSFVGCSSIMLCISIVSSILVA